jgi:hypothetical protein
MARIQLGEVHRSSLCQTSSTHPGCYALHHTCVPRLHGVSIAKKGAFGPNFQIVVSKSWWINTRKAEEQGEQLSECHALSF